MSQGAVIALLGAGLITVLVRRRSVAIAAVSIQSVILGVMAIAHAEGHSVTLATAGLILILKGVLLPVILANTVRGAREARPVTEKLHAMTRLALALALCLVTVWAVGDLGLRPRFAGTGAAALMALGLAIALLRRATLFQALGFIVAENGIYLAALAVPLGVPFLIEVGIVFDLLLTVACAALFTTTIRARMGSADSTRLRDLHD